MDETERWIQRKGYVRRRVLLCVRVLGPLCWVLVSAWCVRAETEKESPFHRAPYMIVVRDIYYPFGLIYPHASVAPLSHDSKKGKRIGRPEGKDAGLSERIHTSNIAFTFFNMPPCLFYYYYYFSLLFSRFSWPRGTGALADASGLKKFNIFRRKREKYSLRESIGR